MLHPHTPRASFVTVPERDPLAGRQLTVRKTIARRAGKTMDAQAAAQLEQNSASLYGQMARSAIRPHWV
jgi:hypothetical protein